ncbi:O-methyltransferase family 3 [Niveomyces insectorum RCEF 264]|uniref:O-methyltransferase family 3 n=1 Tax=Niveomyces insectorum RCEF 264 TaxID=1081102 RepID=A0A167VER2_9HYPO|nr:O-methyltransferase family 3 [Niveomyces insectorum RCEF 264]
MKANTPTLFPNVKVATKVIDYAAAKSDTLPAPLLQYHARIVQLEESNYTISTAQGQAMSFLAQLLGAKRVLEIGVYCGFSSMVWSHAVGPEGKVTGLEVEPEYAAAARAGYAEVGVHNAEVIVGDALETLAGLDPDEPYDLVFIDAQKTGYPQYLATLLAKSAPGTARRLVRAGGLIVADNVLRRGLVADASADNPEAEGGPRNYRVVRRTTEYSVRRECCHRIGKAFPFSPLMIASTRAEGLSRYAQFVLRVPAWRFATIAVPRLLPTDVCRRWLATEEEGGAAVPTDGHHAQSTCDELTKRGIRFIA